MNIERELRNKISLIVDRYLLLNISFKDVRKYLIGKNFNIILKELSVIEEMYLMGNGDKTYKDFKILVKDIMITTLKDRKYHLLDNKQKSTIVKKYENFDFHYFKNKITTNNSTNNIEIDNELDPFDEEDWDEGDYIDDNNIRIGDKIIVKEKFFRFKLFGGGNIDKDYKRTISRVGDIFQLKHIINKTYIFHNINRPTDFTYFGGGIDLEIDPPYFKIKIWLFDKLMKNGKIEFRQ